MVYVCTSPSRQQGLWSSAWGSFMLYPGSWPVAWHLLLFKGNWGWNLLMTTFVWSCDFSPTSSRFSWWPRACISLSGADMGNWVPWKRDRVRGVEVSKAGNDLYFNVFICLQKAWGQCFQPPGLRTSLGHWTKNGGSLLGRQYRKVALINDFSPLGKVTAFGARQMGI